MKKFSRSSALQKHYEIIHEMSAISASLENTHEFSVSVCNSGRSLTVSNTANKSWLTFSQICSTFAQMHFKKFKQHFHVSQSLIQKLFYILIVSASHLNGYGKVCHKPTVEPPEKMPTSK